jgi:hypothetical protein
MRFHAKERQVPGNDALEYVWGFEALDTGTIQSATLLVRIMIAKITDDKRLEQILRAIPIRAEVEGWNCVYWVKEALEALQADGKVVGTSVLDWQKVRDRAMSFIEAKEKAGRWRAEGNYDMERAATWDLIEDKEVIP